eukprot:1159966-Pelagomonas_calceolata.AAC.6
MLSTGALGDNRGCTVLNCSRSLAASDDRLRHIQTWTIYRAGFSLIAVRGIPLHLIAHQLRGNDILLIRH